VPYDVAWGHATNQAGFAHYYYGNYFPIQYHVFQVADLLSRALGIGGPTALKAINLVFDAGLFGVILLLSRRLHLRGRVAPIYWLAPYTLAMDWLGYVDFEMAFFAVLGVLLVAGGGSTPRLLAAGAALGVALMMKPQALTLAVVFFGLIAFGLFWSNRRRELLRSFALLAVGPLGLFVAYTAWLASAGRGTTFLAHSLLDFGKFQGVQLTANMTNIWLPIAEGFRAGTEPLYSVVGPHYLQTVAKAATVLLIALGIVAVARKIDERPLHESLIFGFAIATLTLPMTMTRAHENHLFLGVVFGLLTSSLVRSRTFSIALQVIVALQFVALVSLYQFGQTGPKWQFLSRLSSYFLDHLWGAAGALTFIAYCLAYSSLLALLIRSRSSTRAHPTGDFAEVSV
jgi:hypothetical protein